MSRYFIPLTQAQPKNALIDFSPINNGLNAIGEAKQQATRNAMMQDELQMRKDQNQFQRDRATAQDEQARRERGGKMAAAIMQMPDSDPGKQGAWRRYLSEFGDGNHSPEELDFRTGPKIAAAAFGHVVDPLERQTAQARLGLIQAQTAQANQRAEPDPIKALIAERVSRARQATSPQQPAQPQTQGQVIPQSYDGGGTVPGVQFVADGQPQTAPQQPQAPDMVDTPLGKMPKSEARDLAGMMLLDPRYATAGKAILDGLDGPGQGQMGKTVQNQIEEKTANSATMLSRLTDIERRFDPTFLEIPTRLKMTGASWSAKVGAKLAPDQQEELSRFAAFRSASVNNLNTILKELSGAAVTPQEYERLKNDVPQAGTGVFDGDDPVSFRSKLDRSMQTARAAIARYNFMRSKGLNFDRESLDQFLSLDDVPAAYNKRGAEIRSQLQKSGADANTIDQSVRRKLKQEFGI